MCHFSRRHCILFPNEWVIGAVPSGSRFLLLLKRCLNLSLDHRVRLFFFFPFHLVYSTCRLFRLLLDDLPPPPPQRWCNQLFVVTVIWPMLPSYCSAVTEKSQMATSMIEPGSTGSRRPHARQLAICLLCSAWTISSPCYPFDLLQYLLCHKRWVSEPLPSSPNCFVHT